MAYRVSQIRRDTTDEKYMKRLDVTPIEYTSPDPFLTIDSSSSSSDTEIRKTFKDFALTFENETNKFLAGKTYYLRFWIQRIPKYWYSGSTTAGEVGSLSDGDSLSIRLCLAASLNQDEENEPLEVIKDIKVNPYGQVKDNNGNPIFQYSVYSIVFTPTKDSKILIFRINRNRYDALKGSIGEERNWLYDQVGNDDLSTIIEGLRFHEGSETDSLNPQILIYTHPVRIIYNVDDFQAIVNKTGDVCLLQNIIPDQQTWLKFGYQSRPGNLIVVNGLPIIVGRSGIYEINNGTTIQSFMIAAPLGDISTNIDPFLLDFAYNG